MSDEEQELSALRDSIKRKGNNSYYYAHAPQTVESVPAPTVWDGNINPKLLAVSAPSSSSGSSGQKSQKSKGGSDVIELTELNFNALVMESNDHWLGKVFFFDI